MSDFNCRHMSTTLHVCTPMGVSRYKTPPKKALLSCHKDFSSKDWILTIWKHGGRFVIILL